jgi:hypothetical protein
MFLNHIKKSFPNFSDNYNEKYNTEYKRIRFERIESFKDSLLLCGDYTKGIA